ncbi:MAG: LSM domain-containing protein [archaeon]
MSDRPFDFLKTAIESNVLVRLKDNKDFRGKLKAFDIHMNLVLDDAEDMSNGGHIKLGRVLLRGDTVVYISPETVQ